MSNWGEADMSPPGAFNYETRSLSVSLAGSFTHFRLGTMSIFAEECWQMCNKSDAHGTQTELLKCRGNGDRNFVLTNAD